jgi:hypothetical protein
MTKLIKIIKYIFGEPGFQILLFLLLAIAYTAWWLSQEWQACTKLYDNTPAQIICFTNDTN